MITYFAERAYAVMEPWTVLATAVPMNVKLACIAEAALVIMPFALTEAKIHPVISLVVVALDVDLLALTTLTALLTVKKACFAE